MTSIDAQQEKIKKRNRKTAFWLFFWVIFVVLYAFLKQAGWLFHS